MHEDMDDGGVDVYTMQAHYDEMWAESVERVTKSLSYLDVMSSESPVPEGERWVCPMTVSGGGVCVCVYM